jgi:precorrin-6A/cobalt-precorrin-6A reductase
MIFLAAGTQDGRELAGYLLEHGQQVTASVVSHYGQQLMAGYQSKGLVINDAPLDAEHLAAYLEKHDIKVLVDATHPYASHVSENAMTACQRTGVPYLRYERQRVPARYDKLFHVKDYAEAAKRAAELGQHVFITTGSHNLKAFVQSPYMAEHELTVRVLPSTEVIASCSGLGLTPKHIVALQGPFSEELNEALFCKYEADVVVTKDGGTIGGTDTKLAAAAKLGLPVVMVDRPCLVYDNLAETFEDVLAFVERG